MPSQTYTTPGTASLDLADKHDVTFQIWSSGGQGGATALEDCGGGGGGGFAAGSIPNATILDWIDQAGSTSIDIVVGDKADGQDALPTSIKFGDDGVNVSPGGDGGDTTFGTGGGMTDDDFDWVTADYTGGAGAGHAVGGSFSGGSGGGSSAGTASNGNAGVAGDIIGNAGAGGAAVTGGGAGGAGGALGVVGTAASLPGGGGGGAGDDAPGDPDVGALGGGAKVVVSWTAGAPDATAPEFASAAIATNGLSTVVTITEAGSPPLLPASSITGFTITLASGRSVSVSSAARTGNTEITLTLSAAIYSTDTVTLNYSSGNVTDSATPANSLGTITGGAVTNNSTVAAPGAASKMGLGLGLGI